jgi:hypothetical protein
MSVISSITCHLLFIGGREMTESSAVNFVRTRVEMPWHATVRLFWGTAFQAW